MAPGGRSTRSASTIQRERDANAKKRKHYLQSMTRARAKVDAENFDEKSQFELEELLATLGADWNEFRAEYAKVFDEVIEVDDEKTLEPQFVDAEDLYQYTRSKVRARIAGLIPKIPQPPVVAPQPVMVELKQPDALANIPNSWGKFNGDYAEWPSFRDRFKARIHERTDILITHKWGYLRSSLSGDALRAMGTWKDTDENYEHAWNRLFSQYNDDYMAVQTLIQKLLNIPRIHRATSDTVHGCLSQLSRYVSTQSWDPLLIFLIVDKLDNDTRKDWEKLRHSGTQRDETHGSNHSLNTAPDEANDSLDAESAASKICFCWNWMTIFEYTNEMTNA